MFDNAYTRYLGVNELLGSVLLCSPLLTVHAGLAGTGWTGLSNVPLFYRLGVAALPSSTSSVNTVDGDDWS